MVLLSHMDVGASMVLENRFAFPNTVVATMQRERPTGFSGVPASFYMLLSRSDFPKLDWSFLRYMNSGGGGLRISAVRQLQDILPKTSICITYGQTEASARLGYLPPKMLDAKIGSIGIAAPGNKLRVVNEQGRDVEVGEIGEIIASGPNVMPGYFRNPEATRNTIRDGWLYTGDMARIDEDGYIFIVSRMSDFIKSASYRISPAEIEEVVAEVGGIEDSAAFGVEDELTGESIAVAVICEKETFSPEQIRNHCIARLPFYKVPKYIIHDPDIPRTPSGKKRYFLLRERYRSIGQPSGTGSN
jgi:acyl-CoA synthetase (AMP-forming)/AMP-acid ligase II